MHVCACMFGKGGGAILSPALQFHGGLNAGKWMISETDIMASVSCPLMSDEQMQFHSPKKVLPNMLLGGFGDGKVGESLLKSSEFGDGA